MLAGSQLRPLTSLYLSRIWVVSGAPAARLVIASEFSRALRVAQSGWAMESRGHPWLVSRHDRHR